MDFQLLAKAVRDQLSLCHSLLRNHRLRTQAHLARPTRVGRTQLDRAKARQMRIVTMIHLAAQTLVHMSLLP